jgi:hypothetical protein
MLGHIIKRHWESAVFVQILTGNRYIPARDKIAGFKE